jgi:hypothetical protein
MNIQIRKERNLKTMAGERGEGGGGIDCEIKLAIQRKRGDDLEPSICLMRLVLANQLGTQEEGVMSTTLSFPTVMKPKFNRPVEERNHF